jgi:hypothetical protein
LSNDGGDSSSDGDLSKQFKLDGLSHGSSAESLLFESLDLNVNSVILVVPTLLDKGLEFSNFSLVIIEEGLGVSDLEDDFRLGEGVCKIESGVATVFERFAQQGVELGFEEPIINVLTKAVFHLGV